METPGSSVRMTRSRTRQLTPYYAKPPSTPSTASKTSEKNGRLPLGNVTNDSPICGIVPNLKQDSEVHEQKVVEPACLSDVDPSKEAKSDVADSSVADGEEVLRAQVKRLLERQANAPAFPLCATTTSVHPLLQSVAMNLAAPTPANTPCVVGQAAVVRCSPNNATMSRDSASALLRRMNTPGAVPFDEVCRLLQALSPDQYKAVKIDESAIKITQPVIAEIEVSGPGECDSPITRALCFDSQVEDCGEVCGDTVKTTPRLRSVLVVPSSLEKSPSLHWAECGNESKERDGIPSDTDDQSSGASPTSWGSTLQTMFDMVATSEPHAEAKYGDATPASKWSVGGNAGTPVFQPLSGQLDCTALRRTPQLAIWKHRDASSPHSDEDEDKWQEDDEADHVEDLEEYDEFLDKELCSQMSSMELAPLRGLPAPAGTHIRFVEKDDGTLEEEVEVLGCSSEYQPEEILKLRGLPTPKGKHTRFED